MSVVTEKVIIVDDDDILRGTLKRLLQQRFYVVEDFAAAEEALEAAASFTPLTCLLLDVWLPGMNGLELHQELMRRGIRRPTVFMTGEPSVPMCAQALKQGGVDFITKPFHFAELLVLLRASFVRLHEDSVRLRRESEWQERLRKLSGREMEVLPQIVAGKLNKQIAADLGITEKTVKVHRAHLHRKLEVASLAELVRMAVVYGLEPKGIGPKSNSQPPSD